MSEQWQAVSLETVVARVAGEHRYVPSALRGVSRCTCGIQFHGMPHEHQAHHATHLADAIRTHLAGQRTRVMEALLAEHIDGDFLVGAGRSVGNEGGDVALSQARVSEVAAWATDAVLGLLAGGGS